MPENKKLERIIEFTPAFDKRDPNPKKNYGVHGVELRFVVKGEAGAVQFLIFTNWHLPHVQKAMVNRAFRTHTDIVVTLYKVSAWALYSLGIGFIYPNGQAMARINKEWTKYYPDSPSSTNQLGPGTGPGPSSSPEEESSEPRIDPCYRDLLCRECNLWNHEKGKCTINRIPAQFFYSGGTPGSIPTEEEDDS
jgi:hypothetical protein